MSTPPVIIEGPEQLQVDPTLADAGLPPAVGVRSFQVFRASKAVPQVTDGKGWTYHHHVDMACWKGRLYVGWNSCERDEDVWPSRELYSTSLDGRTWTDPVELFPQGVSTPLRMYFFRGSNDRMLAIAGHRTDTADTSEDRKWPLVVREIRADHTLGEVFILQGSSPTIPMFDASRDDGFMTACRELLSDNVFLEQQDRGKLLGPRRMKWHDAKSWPAGAVPGDSDKWVAGKAYSFIRRGDGVLVGFSKMGWVTTSRDDGKTWDQPLVPPTLVTGKAKVWAQRTRDGRYALVYNPSRKNRFPLVIVTSDDGIHFRDMRIVQGELPIQRYAGLHRSIGPQYVRGISKWSDDGSRAGEKAMWLAYSMSKEDIWVSRVPLPVRADVPSDDEPTAWNLYSPKWAPVTIEGDAVRLEDRDPHDYASAARIFAERGNATVTFEAMAEQSDGTLEVEIAPKFLPPAPLRKTLHFDRANAWQSFAIAAPSLHRVTFRTAPYRGIGGAKPVDPDTDRPHERVVFRVRNVHPSA
jgi:hypothetical protein